MYPSYLYLHEDLIARGESDERGAIKGEGKELHNDELYSYNFQVMLLGESKNDGISGRKHVTGKKRKGRQFYSNLVARCRLRNAS